MPQSIIKKFTTMGLHEKRNKALNFTYRASCTIDDEADDNPNPITGAIAGVDHGG